VVTGRPMTGPIYWCEHQSSEIMENPPSNNSNGVCITSMNKRLLKDVNCVGGGRWKLGEISLSSLDLAYLVFLLAYLLD
jgi:hypothetical protein